MKLAFVQRLSLPFKATLAACAISVASPASAQTSIKYTEVTSQAGLDGALRSIAPLARFGVMQGGGVVGDFNNDGFQDIFMLAGGGLPDYLYINNGDGTFTNQAAQWGVDRAHHSFGASAVDFNNDGYLDIFITSYGNAAFAPAAGRMILYKNNGPDADGNWSFTDVAVEAGVNRLLGTLRDGMGSGWGDYNLDGYLDLMICGYNEFSPLNRLFRNDGPDEHGVYRFTDVTAEAGIEFTGVPGFIPHFVDMNDDLYPEIILVSDTGRSRYLVNNKDGTFTDMTHTVNGLNTANAMGIDVGDINNNGMLDMYISSITFPTTNGPGNVLLMQNPDGSFTNTARNNGTYAGYWGWGVLVQDLDHDTDLDIVETNGYVGAYSGDPSVIFENMGDGDTFNEVAAEAGFIHTGQGRGMARIDIENDGDLDILIFENNGGLRLYKNLIVDDFITPSDRNWVRVMLDTRANDALAPQGIGAMVTIVTADLHQRRPMHCGANHASSSPVEIHAGLGTASVIDAIQVRWPDGSYTTRANVPANQILTINAPATRVDYNPDGITDINDVFAFITLFQNKDLAADHNGDLQLNFYDIADFIYDYINTP